jgi:hypothetical protein
MTANEILKRDNPFTGILYDFDRGIKGNQKRRQVRQGRGVTDVPPHGAAIPDLRVAHFVRRHRE